MKKSKYSDSQIMAILKQAEAGSPILDLCREHGMSTATSHKWCSKYGGMDASMISRLKDIEDENRRLKKMYAEERLKAEIIQDQMCRARVCRICRHRKPMITTRLILKSWPI